MNRWLAVLAAGLVSLCGPAPAVAAPPNRLPHRAPPRPSAAPLSPRLVSGRAVRCYDRCEVAIEASPAGNPFDPEQNEVRGRFVSPSGRLIEVNGFWFQDFERSLAGGRESLRPREAPGWRVRFTPDEVGPWRFTVVARMGRQSQTSSVQVVEALPPRRGSGGFVRVAARGFASSEGDAILPVGENLAYSGSAATYAYDRWLERLSGEGATYARIWAGPFAPLALETGRGRYDLEAAWRLDHIVETASLRGVRVALCIESFNALRIRPGPALWNRNPYNRTRGGPLTRPAEFFTDATARQGFRKRLRYLTARWGWSPTVLSWELMNEIDLTEGFDAQTCRTWVAEMAQALRATDPYAHPITVSFGAPEGVPEIEALPALDYLQAHVYGAADLGRAIADICREKRERHGRPVVVSEAAASVRKAVTERDEAGTWLHEALWAPLFAGAAGAGMPWWWDTVVDAHNRYDAFRPVVRFARSAPWLPDLPDSVKVLDMRSVAASAPRRGDVVICPTRGGWQRGPANTPATATVESDGAIGGLSSVSRMLHGEERPDLHNPLTLLVDMPQAPFTDDIAPADGRCVIYVTEPPSRGSRLVVDVDGSRRLDQPFDTPDLETPRRYAVAVGGGRHAIRIRNAGAGIIPVAYGLPQYRRSPRPSLQVTGRASNTRAVVWVRNPDAIWLRAALRQPVRPVDPSVVVLEGFLDGDYVVEEWNTETGTSIPYRRRCVDGRITLNVPRIMRDAAYIIQPAQ